MNDSVGQEEVALESTDRYSPTTPLMFPYSRYILTMQRPSVGRLCNAHGFLIKTCLYMERVMHDQYFLLDEDFYNLCVYVSTHARPTEMLNDERWVIESTPFIRSMFRLVRL